MNDLKISTLLCTRLCHDLIGPAGAVVNGVELLCENPANVDDEILELIKHSARETTRRLKYYRMSFGVSAGGQTITVIRAVADEYFENSKITLDWSEQIMGTAVLLPVNLTPILLNIILCGAEALPRGGRIAIDGALSESGFTLQLLAAGEAIKVDDDALLSLSSERDPTTLEARGMAPYMTARLVSAAGGRIEATHSSETMEYSIFLPNKA